MSSSSGGGFDVGVGIAGGTNLEAVQQGQGVAALLVMLAVLCFIFAYCCWGAPFCRSLCRRHCCCRLEDPEPETRFGSSDQAMVATPTIILLPHGRMLVVDGMVFTQFQADTTGLDLVELGESVIRAQGNPRIANRHHLRSSQGSILEMDAETPSKESLGSITCFPPPTYESIYGKDEASLPPSYSDILLHRFANLPYELEMQDYRHDGKEDIEMQTLERGPPRIIENPVTSNFPYASIVNLNFPQQNVVRNRTLIDNPLHEYYADLNSPGRPSNPLDNEFYQIPSISTSRIEAQDSTTVIENEQVEAQSPSDSLGCDRENDQNEESSSVPVADFDIVDERSQRSNNTSVPDVLRLSTPNYSTSNSDPSPVPSISEERAEEVFGALTDIRESRV